MLPYIAYMDPMGYEVGSLPDDFVWPCPSRRLGNLHAVAVRSAPHKEITTGTAFQKSGAVKLVNTPNKVK